ncbi:hypothetical protein ACFQ38_03860 [Sporosarcina contaminans]|uniref:Uncharacterized protein n=1 Tax=Sporosarcina contaminans TaxID=633403 RepID=A0ABW3TUT9_9BACL
MRAKAQRWEHILALARNEERALRAKAQRWEHILALARNEERALRAKALALRALSAVKLRQALEDKKLRRIMP